MTKASQSRLVRGMEAKRFQEESKFYYMATLQPAFNKKIEEVVETVSRVINILVEIESPHITKQVLDNIQKGAIRRLVQENQVEPTDIIEMPILSISQLGMMPPDVFHGKVAEPAKN